MNTFFSGPARSQMIALALSILLASRCAAQSSPDANAPVASAEQSVSLAFPGISAPDKGDGYAQAHAVLVYRFLICANDIAMGYRFDPTSIVPSAGYWLNGNRIETAPKLINPTIRISGSITTGLDVIGTISDAVAPVAAQPLTCSSSLSRIGALRDYLGPKATSDQVKHLIGSLSFRPAPLKTALVNDALERSSQEAAAAPDAPLPPPSAALASYLTELQRSQQQTADFQAKRAEYESELQAARDARAHYETQYGPKPPKAKKRHHKTDADATVAEKAPAE
jgi:hypothetical protein